MNNNNNKKGVRNMRATFIKRRIMVIAMVLLPIWGANALLDNNDPTCDVPVVRAQKGDTMWDIAYKHCPHNRMDDVMNEVIKTNETSYVQVGQMVVLPWNNKKGNK